MGFKNIKIYNGGIKDWKIRGLPLDSTEKIPDYPVNYIMPDELSKLITEADKTNCLDSEKKPILSFIDIRDYHLDKFLIADKHTIKTTCKTHKFIIDDIRSAEKRAILPDGKWIIFCETGGRGHYLSKFMYRLGKKDIYILKGGILNWQNKGFETTIRDHNNAEH